MIVETPIKAIMFSSNFAVHILNKDLSFMQFTMLSRYLHAAVKKYPDIRSFPQCFAAEEGNMNQGILFFLDAVSNPMTVWP